MLNYYYVVEINQNPQDRHADLTLEKAIELANPDPSSKILACIVQANDPNIALRNFNYKNLINPKFVKEAYEKHLKSFNLDH
jgi:hypothetical protein